MVVRVLELTVLLRQNSGCFFLVETEEFMLNSSCEMSHTKSTNVGLLGDWRRTLSFFFFQENMLILTFDLASYSHLKACYSKSHKCQREHVLKPPNAARPPLFDY